jgi:hypothetical protein
VKRKVVLPVVIFVTLSITSCRKNYECTCTEVYSGGSYTFIAGAKSTKQDAQGWCNAFQASQAQPGIVTTCTLH